MLKFSYKAYRRSFVEDWKTARKVWSSREGILIRLEDEDGRLGFGEIAPIESFGTESLVAALSVCVSLSQKIEYEETKEKLLLMPATRFAFESALALIESEGQFASLDEPWPVCGLARELSELGEIHHLMALGYRSIKLKIGAKAFEVERHYVDRVLEVTEGKLPIRLDANASLDLAQSIKWLEYLSDLPNIEFLEQPMAKGEEEPMMALHGDYPVSLALDESVCHVDDLKRWRDRQWPGVFVLKPSISGGLQDLRNELGQGMLDAVFSSSLETQIGAAMALEVALEFPSGKRPLGFGVDSLFGKDISNLSIGAFLQREALPSTDDMQALWNQI